jgi:hypothetical protein
MSRAHNFDCRLQTWVPSEVSDAVEFVAREQLLDTADVLRQAIIMYLRGLGVMPKQTRANGHHQVNADAQHVATNQ